MKRIHQVEGEREELLLDLDEIARQGARRMLAEALEAEVADYIEAARRAASRHKAQLKVNPEAASRDGSSVGRKSFLVS